jgi:hypothetical protein
MPITKKVLNSKIQEIKNPRNLNEIAADIQTHKENIGKSILEIGNLLYEAKEQFIKHGQFNSWVCNDLKMNKRKAERFMKLSREYSNATALSFLGQSKALELTALPKGEREEFIADKHSVKGALKDVYEMTSRELKIVIKQRSEPTNSEEQSEDENIIIEAKRISDVYSRKDFYSQFEYVNECINAMLDYADREKENIEIFEDIYTAIRNFCNATLEIISVKFNEIN